jgi:hypothetical protein
MNLRVLEKDGKVMTQAEGQGAFAILWQGEMECRASFDPGRQAGLGRDGKSFELHQAGGVFVAKRKP